MDNLFLVSGRFKGYTEEWIIPTEENELHKFALSNNLDGIKSAIYERTNQDIYLENAMWKFNPKLSIAIKRSMDRHCADYSMTTIDNGKLIIVNMRLRDKWFITEYEEIDGYFYDHDVLNILRRLNYFKLRDANDNSG